MMASVSGSFRRNVVPSARFGNHIDASAQFLHLLPHHVHAHAAPGHVGDLVGGGKSGMKDQRENLALGQLGIRLRSDFSRALCEEFSRAGKPRPSSEIWITMCPA